MFWVGSWEFPFYAAMVTACSRPAMAGLLTAVFMHMIPLCMTEPPIAAVWLNMDTDGVSGRLVSDIERLTGSIYNYS
jgi:hypothetical protein